MIIKTINLLTIAVVLLMMMLTATAFENPGTSLIKASAVSTTVDTVPENGGTPADKIFEAVDEEAYFPGNEEGWRNFLVQNLNPSAPVDNGAPAGTYTVYIQFIVDLDGKLSAIKALTKHGYGMEAEVMRILRKSPPWIPAVQAGKPVRAYRKQPVTFQVMEDKKRKRKKD